MKHILLHYLELNDIQKELIKKAGTYNIKTMLAEINDIKMAARWLVKSEFLI